MKKIFAILTLGAMILSLSACGEPVVGGDAGLEDDLVGMPNPFTDYETLEEAVSAVGFDFTVPDAIGDHEVRLIQVLEESSMIQVFYGEGESDILIRKEPGSGDISGDYNSYSQSSEKTVDGRTVTMKGENDLTMVALWEDGGYTYSIGAGDGMDTDSMAALVAAVE